MAAFLNRAPGLPQASRDHFEDDDGSIFEGDINRFAEAGITKGCNPPDNDHYCPTANVRRGGDLTIYLTDEDDVHEQAPGCSEAYSCTVGDAIHINGQNFVSRPAPWAGESRSAYQRYVLMHEVGHYRDFDDTADSDDPSHHNDEVNCHDRDGDGAREAPVMKQQSIDTGDCTTNGDPLAFERDCVEEAWLPDTTNQGDGDGDTDDQCPHQPTER